MAVITYDDKDSSLPSSNPRKLWRDSDANEVKDVVNENYTEQTKILRQAVASGSNSYSATFSPAISAYTDGMQIKVKFPVASTGSATLNAGAGAKNINKNASTQAGNGDIEANWYTLTYNASIGSGVWTMTASTSSGGGGAVDSVNGQTGVVVLDAGDVGADPAGSASTVAGNLLAHISDTTDAHAASAITNTPAGNIAATTVQNAINELDTEKAPLASPALTGNPTAPTPSAGDNDTSIATTAFVHTEVVGVQDLFIPASAMWPRVTNGASPLAQTEIATSLFNIQSLDFNQTTQQYAQFQITLPRNWNNGTVTFRPYWTAASGSGGVVWELNGGAYSDDDALSTAFGTAQSSTDTFITANDLHIGPESSAITIAGTPADADFLAFQISRVTGNGSDTLTADAKLLGISIRITTDAAKAA